MILLKPSNYMQSIDSMKSIFISLCDMEVVNQLKTNSMGFKQVLDIYDLEDIKMSYRTIVIDFRGYLTIPEQSKQSKILRLLEYGGENVQSTHFITKVINKINTTFGMEVN